MKVNKKMLVVDDDEINRSILASIFKHKFQIKAVDSGEEALRVIEDFKPDIVMLDIMMPGLSGYEVCERIRENFSHEVMKVILVSAISKNEGSKKGLEVGADDYVTKPFDINGIKNVVDSNLAE